MKVKRIKVDIELPKLEFQLRKCNFSQTIPFVQKLIWIAANKRGNVGKHI
jgi:hypothetical protein